MKIYQAIPKSQTPTRDEAGGFYYWGDPQEIKMAISKGTLPANNAVEEKLHAHTDSYTYFIVISGEGFIEVEGREIRVVQDQVLEISPGEKYRVLRSGGLPFNWITVGSIPGNKDKVIY